MEKNTNMRLRDLSETKDEEVPQLQRKRKVVARPQALLSPKKDKVVMATPSSKELIFSYIMPRKMKIREIRENLAFLRRTGIHPLHLMNLVIMIFLLMLLSCRSKASW